MANLLQDHQSQSPGKLFVCMQCIITLALVFGAISCTGYYEMRKSGSGGYGEYRTEKNTIIVYFGGNSLTSARRVKRFALLRCAEVTLESHCKYFVIIEDHGYKTEHSSPGLISSGNTTPMSFGISSSMMDAAFEIDMYQNPPDSSVKNYYNAQDVIDAKGRVDIKIERNYTRKQ